MSSRKRQAYHEITKGACRLRVWCRGQSDAASVHSNIPNNPSGQRKVSKDERKDMMKCFVNRYRKLNAGKFPTASHAMKQIGGSYYFVKWTLQELQQKAVDLPLDDKNEYTINGEQSKESRPLCEVNKITGSPLTDHEEMQNDSQTLDVKCVENGNANADHLEGVQTSSCTKKASSEEFIKPPITDNQSDFVATHDQLKGLAGEVMYPSIENPEHDATDKAASKDVLSLDCPQHKGEQSQVPLESNKNTGETSVKQTQDEEHPKISTFWGNLKSLADVITHMWRKH